MERKVLKIFTTIVYDNGDVEQIPMVIPNSMKTETSDTTIAEEKVDIIENKIDDVKETHSGEILCLDNISGKVAQQLMVLHYAKKARGNENRRYNTEDIDVGIYQTTKALDISKPSVLDKLSRGLKGEFLNGYASMTDFRRMALSFLNEGAHKELMELMLNNVTQKGTGAGYEDKQAINKFFDNPDMDFEYSKVKVGPTIF